MCLLKTFLSISRDHIFLNRVEGGPPSNRNRYRAGRLVTRARLQWSARHRQITLVQVADHGRVLAVDLQEERTPGSHHLHVRSTGGLARPEAFSRRSLASAQISHCGVPHTDRQSWQWLRPKPSNDNSFFREYRAHGSFHEKEADGIRGSGGAGKTEADGLANGDRSGFDMALRTPVDGGNSYVRRCSSSSGDETTGRTCIPGSESQRAFRARGRRNASLNNECVLWILCDEDPSRIQEHERPQKLLDHRWLT